MARSKRKFLSHLDDRGHARMVDVGPKASTHREAEATALVRVGPEVLTLINAGRMPKGDVFAVARVAGIQAAKRTSDLIPLCHPLAIDSVRVDIESAPPDSVIIRAVVAITGKTGVEMEALTAASVAALSIYDMCKSVTKAIEIGPIRLERKTGGKSGVFRRPRPR